MNALASASTFVARFGDATSLAALLVGIHALAATISLICGVVVIHPRRTTFRRSWGSVYLWSLVAMALFLGGAMLLRWEAYTSVERISFSALLVLAFYMTKRAFSATAQLEAGENALDPAVIHHVGFTLIALLEGFVIVALLDLGSDGWIVGGVAVAVVVLGRRTIDRIVARNRQRARRIDREGRAKGAVDRE